MASNKITNRGIKFQGGWFSRNIPSKADDMNLIRARCSMMHPVFNTEIQILPDNVIQTVANVIRSFDPATKFFISSIISGTNGMRRTPLNGPNHANSVALDLVPTPFDTPLFKDQMGRPRSPQFHWNQYLQRHLVSLNDDKKVTCCVLIEPDHLHFDAAHEPGVYQLLNDKGCYHNAAPKGGLVTKPSIKRIGKNRVTPTGLKKFILNVYHGRNSPKAPQSFEELKNLINK